jgi:hypothetical protein
MIPIPAQSFAAISRKLPVHETPRGFSLICFVEDILVLKRWRDSIPIAPILGDMCRVPLSPRVKTRCSALLLVKKPLDQYFQSCFALRQAHF